MYCLFLVLTLFIIAEKNKASHQILHDLSLPYRFTFLFNLISLTSNFTYRQQGYVSYEKNHIFCNFKHPLHFLFFMQKG